MYTFKYYRPAWAAQMYADNGVNRPEGWVVSPIVYEDKALVQQTVDALVARGCQAQIVSGNER